MATTGSSRLLLAVTGGIAAYKAAELASRLVQGGALVDVILTAGAEAFVRPLTFSALTGRAVHTDAFAPWRDGWSGHVSLGGEADLLIVAPASANAVARLALGLADDLLGTVALSTGAPLLVAPAMEHRMFHHPATQDHLLTLRRRGAIVIGPEHGRLASGASGDGRLAAVETIVGTIGMVLGRDGPLAGRRIVITAGGTREPLDPVRYLGNRSSGAMGHALAVAARDRGAAVDLVTGPTALAPPAGVAVVPVETADQMLAAVRHAVDGADVLIMAAAVSDFRPAVVETRKIKKRADTAGRPLALVRTADILQSVDTPGLVRIGFAAETDDLETNAASKLASKRLALIVANDATLTIGSKQSTAVLLRPDAPPERLPAMPKTALAGLILDRLLPLLPTAGPPREPG